MQSLGFEVDQVHVNTDTTAQLPSPVDSLPTEEDLMEQQPVSHTVDEVFDDFVVNFDMKSSFQRQRVSFPMVVTTDGADADTIAASEWQHRYLFMRQDFCTVLWNSETEMMQMSETPVEASAAVEQIYLHSHTITTLHFERDERGQWILVSIDNEDFDHHPLGEFLYFYSQFATDSLYQQRHLAPHLHYVTADDNSDEGIIEGTIDSDQWREFAPELPHDAITNIRYGQSYHDPYRIVMQMQGFGGGFQALFYFRRDNGHWKLTGFEN